MPEKICPLSFPRGKDELANCIKERCQWWIGVYEREKGVLRGGKNRVYPIQNCAIVILAQKNAEGLIDV